MDRTTRRQLAGTGAFLALVALAALYFSPAGVASAIAGMAEDPVTLALGIAALYAIRPLFAWPISPISAIVGYTLGITYGIPVALVGATATCIPPFLVARYLGETGGLFSRFNDAGRQVVSVTGPTRGVLAGRLSPIPADPVSYGAGVAGVSTPAFLVGTVLGEIPWVIVEVLAGASMRQVATHGFDAGLHLLLAAFALSVLLLAGPVYRHATTGQPA
jgi:uncharacterized membrane protein YdjX (TVP38/TMEM64 family)